MDIPHILSCMVRTMTETKPPRITALRELREAEGSGPFNILIGTILSARTRDENTARVVRNLFDVYGTPQELAGADIVDVERIIHSIGFYRVKARRIIQVARIISDTYGGVVPDDIDKLVSLPGVGRKTANCVLVYAFDKPAIPVDIHVHRISNRLGIVDTKTPQETEAALTDMVPVHYWTRINETFVTYGQSVCKPVSPMCGECQLSDICKHARRAALKDIETRQDPPRPQ